jgi:integrase/recombinase XerD
VTALAPTLQAFFTQRLPQRGASPHTVAAYRDCMRLLLGYLYETTRVAPSRLDFEHLDATRIGAFLEHLERDRHVSVATRNARLAAVHSLFRFAALQHPEHAETIARVLAIQPKHDEQEDVCFLTVTETEALLAAPDLARRTGRRDRAMLLVAAQTGLRVSELVSLRIEDVHFGAGAHVDCLGKGRKYRSTPLTPQVAEVLKAWLKERGGSAADPVFPGPRGEPLSRDAVRRLVNKYVAAATPGCPSLATKPISAHSLRHTAAMRLLENGTDVFVIALLLGHSNPRTTEQIYLHANMALKEQALARTAPLCTAPGRYRPPDQLLAFLESL